MGLVAPFLFMTHYRIPCPNDIESRYCNGTLGFVKKGVTDLSGFTSICPKCGWLAEITMKNGAVVIDLSKKRLDAINYPTVVKSD